MNVVKDHQLRHYGIEKTLKAVEQTLLRELKNSDCDKTALGYELKRMQHLDRLKVAHAKDSFFNPDAGTLLPSLDTALASCSQGGLASTPQPSNVFAPDRSVDYGSLISERDFVTTNELRGHCERLDTQPSRRQRIIIARSCEPRTLEARAFKDSSQGFGATATDRERPQLGSLDPKAMQTMSATHHFKDDSKMSIQAGKLL